MFDLVLIERVLRQNESIVTAWYGRTAQETKDLIAARAEFAKLRKALTEAAPVTFGASGFGCRRVGAVDTHVPSASVYLIEAPLELAHHRVLLVKCDD